MSSTRDIGRERSVSLVVPVLDEEHGVRAMLADVARLRPSWLREVLFVDGGSRDGTAANIARAAEESDVVRPALRQRGRGLAAAWREGIASARGAVIVTMDGDGAHRVEDVPRLLDALSEGPEIAIARRYGPGGSGMPGRALSERAASLLAAAAWSARVGFQLRDPLHGFRARTARLARALAPALAHIEGNVWLGCEAAEAMRRGATVAEVPIAYGRRLGGVEHKRLGREAWHLARRLVLGTR